MPLTYAVNVLVMYAHGGRFESRSSQSLPYSLFISTQFGFWCAYLLESEKDGATLPVAKHFMAEHIVMRC